MKYNFLLTCLMMCPLCIFAQNRDNITEGHPDIADNISEELTWSLSRRNYLVPIYVKCNDSSDVQLCLATSWDLFCNYQYRNSLSEDEFRQLLKKTIKQNDTLQGICAQDFEFLHNSTHGLSRGVAFVTILNGNGLKYLKYDKDVIIRMFFDSRKCYKGDMSNLPAIAYRLKDYGVLLKFSNDGIIYCDVSKHHHS